MYASACCRLHFLYHAASLVTLTCALVLAAGKRDPRSYDQPVDVFRGCCEALALLLIVAKGIFEIHHIAT